MPGLVPGIHELESETRGTWVAGTSPAMTDASDYPNSPSATSPSAPTTMRHHTNSENPWLDT